ncbi:MAG TPA: UDP-glucose/GDP-mannose dehydrogenase family protein [Candidatus Omnitrophota bacterium]|nr:UDP-glucose/GDP-mannose dehydrogenase family protein [Candidatus Omnitrophota bacterium]HRY85364.1 UDP-glucose/GDP-mannose dehydrogenase family protein [Candidatus Omnitrophota bacterium]
MKIGIIGSGYVGLVTGTCLAHLGHKVTCIDQDRRKIQTLKKGKIPFYEPGLFEMVRENVAAKRLSFSTEISSVVNRCEVLFICVHTPPKPDGEADLSFVEKVARQIAIHLRKYCLIVEKSTVPVETGEWVRRTIKRNVKKGVHFDVASNPEFLREGSAIHDFLQPDRIVIGVSSERAEKIFRSLYSPLKAPMIVTDIKSAELIKHAANSFLATKISFANAVSRVCDAVGADIEKVALGMGLDPRIGKQFLKAGIGFGGSCFPKDVGAFLHISEKLGARFELLADVLRINETQARYFFEKIKNSMKNLRGKTVGVLGLAFKPDTDDMRSAPSIPIIQMLQKEGVRVKAYDPQAVSKAAEILQNVDYTATPYEAVHGAHAVAVLTEWSEFLNLDWGRIKKLMPGHFFFDGRNMFQPAEMKKNGFRYFSVGRPSA